MTIESLSVIRPDNHTFHSLATLEEFRRDPVFPVPSPDGYFMSTKFSEVSIKRHMYGWPIQAEDIAGSFTDSPRRDSLNFIMQTSMLTMTEPP